MLAPERDPVRVSLTLGARERPQRIEVYEPDTDVTHRIDTDSSVDLDDRAAVAANLERMGRALAEVLAGRRFRIEGVVDQPVERALGVLLALAFTGEPESEAGASAADAGETAAALPRRLATREPTLRLSAPEISGTSSVTFRTPNSLAGRPAGRGCG